jgi:hypothetical protein
MAKKLVQRIPPPALLDQELHERGLTLTPEAWRIVHDLWALGQDKFPPEYLYRAVVHE